MLLGGDDSGECDLSLVNRNYGMDLRKFYSFLFSSHFIQGSFLYSNFPFFWEETFIPVPKHCLCFNFFKKGNNVAFISRLANGIP